MEFYLSSNIIKDLQREYIESKKEISGEMLFLNKGNDYLLSKVSLYDKTLSEQITVNNKTYIEENIYEEYLNNVSKGIVVKFHSSSFISGTSIPSEEEINFIKSKQDSLDIFNKKFNKNFVYIQGIIGEEEIGFYYFDKGEIKKIKTYTDYDNKEEGILNSFVESFKRKIYKRKRW